MAETSAVGRALAFAGYVGAEIASAEELQKAFLEPEKVEQKPVSELVQRCAVHNEDMHEFLSKSGKPYFAHKVGGKICFGRKQ